MAARKTGKAAEPSTEKVESLFSTEQLLSAERFRDRRDILTALLEPGRQYTLKSVEELIEKYMKGQVK